MTNDEPANVDTEKIEIISPTTNDDTKEEEEGEEDQELQQASKITSETAAFLLSGRGKVEKVEKR